MSSENSQYSPHPLGGTGWEAAQQVNVTGSYAEQVKIPGEMAGRPQDGKPRQIWQRRTAGLGRLGRPSLQELFEGDHQLVMRRHQAVFILPPALPAKPRHLCI